ncbi:hypothetical protein GGI16_001635 [Coemansia sp. S142-1]|nr:hypothetical protein GGI16_001635 [Coemansia sp. S142-1]
MLNEKVPNKQSNDDPILPIEKALATWNLTRNIVDTSQGKAMLQLYGEGGPTRGFARVSQQQIYKDEITSIWNRQRYSWTRLNITKLGYVYSDENTIVPKINDGYGDAAIARCASAIDPLRVVPGTAMEVSQRLAPPQGSQITAHANFVMMDKKGLAIRRAVQSPHTGELMWHTEVIRDQAVIQEYLRQCCIIKKNMAYNHSANKDEGCGLFDNGEGHRKDFHLFFMAMESL